MNTNQIQWGARSIALIGSLSSGACSAPSAESATAQTNTNVATASAPAFVFDVPALIGENIDQVEQTLGKADKMPEPTDEEQRLVGFEWKKKFTKQGYHLLVKYYPDTKRVYAFTLLEKADSHADPVTGGLDAVANVNSGNSAYHIVLEPKPGHRVEQVDADAPPEMPRFVGITIVPTSDTPTSLPK